MTGVWVGNTDNSPMLKVAGSLGAGYVWKEFMDTTLRGQPNQPFGAPPGVVRARTCGIVEPIFSGSNPGCAVGVGTTRPRPSSSVRGHPAAGGTPRPAPTPAAVRPPAECSSAPRGPPPACARPPS